MTLHFEPGDDQDVDLVTEMVHMSRRRVVGCQSCTSTWVLSGGFAARSSTHCYTSIMGPFIAAVSCSILWSILIFLSLLIFLYSTISKLVKVV